MNVLILSKELAGMRLIQRRISELDEGEELHFRLEWKAEGSNGDIFRGPTDLCIYDTEETGAINMELAGRLKRENPDMEFVFLLNRAFGEVFHEMADLGYHLYLIRPLREETADSVLKQALEKIAFRKRQKKLEEQKKYWDLHEQIIRQQFWSRFINGNISLNPIDILKEAENCGVQISLTDRFHLALFSRQLVRPRKHEVETRTRGELLDFVRGYLEEQKASFYLLDQLRPMLIVKNSSEDSFLEWLEEIIRELKERKLPVCAFYETEVNCEDIFSAASRIVSSEKEDMVSETGVYRAFSDPEQVARVEPVIPEHARELLSNGQLIQFQQVIRSSLQEASQRGETSVLYLKMLKQDVLQAVYGYLSDKRIPAHRCMIPDEQRDADDNAHISVESFCGWMEILFQRIPLEEQKDTVAAEEICKWIRLHIREDISREMLAEQFFMNADYMGRQFKRQTGESIGFYIAAEKMKIARKELMDPRKTIGEIGTGLGYDNFSYFSRIFRRIVGCSPREYRSKQCRTETESCG